MKKTYQKNYHERELLDVLSRLDERKIKTLEALQKEENTLLYAELWQSMKNFVNYVALKTKNQKTGEQKYGKGNADRVRELREMGVDLEDIRSSILMHIMENIHHVLSQPGSRQAGYCVSICNHEMTNIYRSHCPNGNRMWSLQENLGTNDCEESEDDFTLEDVLKGDVSAADWVMGYETFYERMLEKQQEKRERDERMHGEIREDLQRLKTPDQAFVYLCMYDQMRPRHIYAGVEAYAAGGYLPREAAGLLYEQLCRKYALRDADIPAVVKGPLSRGMAEKLSTLDQKKVTNKISDVKLTMPECVKARLKERMKKAESGASLRK